MDHGDIEIIDFEPRYADAFRELNLRWIRQYFQVEAEDERVLSRPGECIVDHGGQILFARLKTDGRIVVTCALKQVSPGCVELAKMAVDPAAQGRGVGNALMAAAIERAARMGADQIVLETNRVLTPAIRLYEKFGFRETPMPRGTPYTRSNLAMRLTLKRPRDAPAER